MKIIQDHTVLHQFVVDTVPAATVLRTVSVDGAVIHNSACLEVLQDLQTQHVQVGNMIIVDVVKLVKMVDCVSVEDVIVCLVCSKCIDDQSTKLTKPTGQMTSWFCQLSRLVINTFAAILYNFRNKWDVLPRCYRLQSFIIYECYAGTQN